MNYKAALILLSFLFLISESALANEGWQTAPFKLQAGYSFSAFNVGDGHTIQFGISKPRQYYNGGDGVLSTIPLLGQAFSANVIGLFTDGKFHPGIKLGYEAQLLILSGKIECSLLNKYIFLTPSIGLGVVTRLGVYTGYNICVNNNEKSGFQVGITYNFANL
jgi:hypothetical protein